jgi:hypothetical protein
LRARRFSASHWAVRSPSQLTPLYAFGALKAILSKIEAHEAESHAKETKAHLKSEAASA